MSRLGDGPELGLTLLMPLLARGWQLHRPGAFAGGRQLWILEKPLPDGGTFEVRRQAETLGEVAVEMFEEAAKLTDWERR